MGSAVAFAASLGNAYQFTIGAGKEAEVKQGKNHYIASIFQAAQVTFVGNFLGTAARLASCTAWPVKLLCNVVPILSLPFCVTASLVKEGTYEQAVQILKSSQVRLTRFLPDSLSQRSIKILTFFADHIGKIAQTVMFVGSIALLAFGHYIQGGATLLALAYREIDRRGFVPRKLSLLVETYMPTIASAALLLGDATLISQALALCQVMALSPSINMFAQHKFDGFFRNKFNVPGHPLSAFEAASPNRRHMPEREIHEVLDGEKHQYELDPTHCSRAVGGSYALPEDRNFGDLLNLYDQLIPPYLVLLRKLKDDERFLDFLEKEFPDQGKLRGKSELIEVLIDALAARKNQTSQAFLTRWTRSQLEVLIAVLKGERRVIGEQQDLDAAIPLSAQILAFLKRLGPERQVEQGDILLKLAIEGGDYCARGIKRAVTEIVDFSVTPAGLPEEVLRTLSPLQGYEAKVLQALQNQRLLLIQGIYADLMRQARIPNGVSQDVHGWDMYRKALSLGLYPMTALERRDVQLMDVAFWTLYEQFRAPILPAYQRTLDTLVAEQATPLEFANHMRQYIETNPRLSTADRESLLTKLSGNEGEWTAGETNARFRRLLLVMLGVLRPKAARV